MSKIVCIGCGAEFIDGQGFIELHYGGCRNNLMGENWCREVSDDWKRPDGVIANMGYWNERILSKTMEDQE